MPKSQFFILHNRRAVRKIVGNKTCDVTFGKVNKCGKFETILSLYRAVNRRQLRTKYCTQEKRGTDDF